MQPSNQNQAPQEPIPEPKTPTADFDFILGPNEQPKSQLPVGVGVLGNKKIVLALGGLVALLIVGVLMLVLSSGGNPATTQLISVAAQQQELIRVSDIALKTSKSSTTLATASTVIASVTSEQKQALGLVSSGGGKLEKGQLTIKLNKKTDEAFASAAASNNLEKTYDEYLSKNLAAYQTQLKALHEIGGPKTKEFASNAYDSADLIIKSL